MGWDYIGRVRGTKCFRIIGEEKRRYYSDYCSGLAKQTLVYLGKGELTKKHLLPAHFYLTTP